MAAVAPQQRAQWLRNDRYPEDTIGRLMEPATAVFPGEQTIADTIDAVRELAKTSFVTYGFVVDDAGRLQGVITMRDLLLSAREQRLEDVMLRDPFFLVPETELPEAMKQVVRRHFPVYPVCEADRTLIGRSEEHTSELQSLAYLVCRLLLEKKKKKHHSPIHRLEDDLRYSIRV